IRGHASARLRPRPRGHYRWAGRGTFLKRSLPAETFGGGALGAPSTPSRGSQPACFLASVRRGFVRRTKPLVARSVALRSSRVFAWTNLPGLSLIAAAHLR